MKVLVVEDDTHTLDYIVKGLKESGHKVDSAQNGLDALALAREFEHDVIVLDRMLPDLNGISLLKEIRTSGVETPVLFLTAMSQIEDRVEGLSAGADDYLVKPFAFAELEARLNSLSRRPPINATNSLLEISDLSMDLLSREVKRQGRELELQPVEFKLLEYLMQNEGRVVTRTMLLEGVWDVHFDPKTNIVETHISRLRAKVDRDFEQKLIHTVRGVGYKIEGK